MSKQKYLKKTTRLSIQSHVFKNADMTETEKKRIRKFHVNVFYFKTNN